MREVSYYILYLLLLYKCVSQNLLLALSAGWDQEETALSDQHFSPEHVKSTLLRLTNKGLIKKYIIAYELIGERKEAVTQWITKEKAYLCKKGHKNTATGSTVCYVITSQGIRSLLANAGDNNLLNAISALSEDSRILVSNWTTPQKMPLMMKDGDAAALCFLADVICYQHKRIPIIRPSSSSEKEKKEEKISKGGGQNISWLLSTATAQIMSQEELPDKGSPMFYKRSEMTWAEACGKNYWIYKLNGLLSTADGLYPIIVTDGYGGTDITKPWGQLLRTAVTTRIG